MSEGGPLSTHAHRPPWTAASEATNLNCESESPLVQIENSYQLLQQPSAIQFRIYKFSLYILTLQFFESRDVRDSPNEHHLSVCMTELVA